MGPAPRAAPAAGPGAGRDCDGPGWLPAGPERPAVALPAPFRTLPMSLASGVAPAPYVQVGCLQHIAVVFRDVLGLALLCHLEYSSEARFK